MSMLQACVLLGLRKHSKKALMDQRMHMLALQQFDSQGFKAQLYPNASSGALLSGYALQGDRLFYLQIYGNPSSNPSLTTSGGLVLRVFGRSRGP